MDRIIKAEATQAKRLLDVYLTSATTGLPVTGLTFSGAEIQVNVNGAGWSNAGGTLPEDGGTNNGAGCYTYQCTTGDVATAGSIKLKVNKAGCNLYIVGGDIDDVTAELAGVGASGVLALIEGSDNVGDVLRDIRASTCGATSGYGTGTVTTKSQDLTKTRRTFTVSSTGRNTSIKGDLT